MKTYPWDSITTTKDATLLSDGYWEVTYTVIQKRSLNGKDWEEKRAEVSEVSRSRNQAESEAVDNMMRLLATYDFNLFNVDEEEDAEYLF